MNKFLKLALSVPKTIWFNFIVFGVKKGIQCPVFVGYDVKIKEIHRGSIIFLGTTKTGAVKIGINHGTEGILEYNSKSFVKVSNGSKLIFEGTADFKEGISLIASYGGEIVIGNNFSSNRGCCISSDTSVQINEDAMLGWNVHIRTSDGHPIFALDDLSHKINENRPVVIGKHVWIASNANILKGAIIPDNSVVGYGACVTRGFNENNSVIAGCPAKIVRTGVHWERE
ncbi:acyltransferase [Neobacillus drentensis]|uniref:acyltransferase n=1 Tax=Neobacillus drentensis TaxID=220684 RepID=UPI002FFD99BF